MNEELKFWVPGVPQPGGSKKGFFNKKTGRVQITEANPKSKDWRATVAHVASEQSPQVLDGPLRVRFDFVFPRPKGHYGTGGNADLVKDSAPPYPTVRPDVLKCSRSTEDALTGIIWRDDSQIVTELITKRYGAQPGAWITIRPEAA